MDSTFWHATAVSELFGKVGLYYIMFLAGLEMNMGDFKETRNKALVLGLLAFIVPIGIGFVANVSYLKYGIITSVLLASMYASHTLVAYPIVTRFGVSRHRSVSIAVGGTAVTDTLTLLVLAVIGGLFKGETGGFFWLWLVVKVIFLGGLIIYFFPRIGRWFFHRYNDHVMQFIFVLAMVFLGAGLMEFVGMEGILGGFPRRIGTEPTHSTRFSVDESSGVRRECAFHSLLSYRSGNVDQPACYLRTRRCPEGGRRNDCNGTDGQVDCLLAHAKDIQDVRSRTKHDVRIE